MRGGRITTVVVLIAALLVAGLTRDLARSKRGTTAASSSGTQHANLSNMNSFALALLLGGLRGPLVMMLWSSSESQKTDKNLEDFDTKVEWIRLLQPEFDTVHIFQIWNKAYNISVMMASLENKYITILDALDYAQRTNLERPNNINIIYAIGGIFFDKLGSSQEKAFYNKRVRDESRPHSLRQKLSRNDPGWRRIEIDPILDEKGNLLPQYLEPHGPKIVNKDNPGEFYDGSELQFLKQYEPFPYGVSPLALGYNYEKRSQVLGSAANQRHAQLSPVVVDSRPPLGLKFWAEEELERGRRAELSAYGRNIPAERRDMETPTASISAEIPVADSTQFPEALYSYDRAGRLARDANREFERHIHSPTFLLTINNYDSMMRGLNGIAELAEADRDYLKSLTAPAAERDALKASAADHYKKSIVIHQNIILKYYLDPPYLVPAMPASVKSVDDLKPEQYGEVLARAYAVRNADKSMDMQAEDRGEYEGYLMRAEARLKKL